LVLGNEECDSTSGCGNDCQALPNWTCDSLTNTCSERCGAYHSEFSSCCDDRNLNNNDGCSSDCLVEDGWSCNKGNCKPICGDGVVTSNERCDNVTGCDPWTCQHSYGYACDPALNQCQPHCGDGIVQFDQGESCDFGALEVEGCTECRTDYGWYCIQSEDRCITDCGDDIKAGTEICDNVFGCTDECQAELGFECSNSNECILRCNDGKMDLGEDCDDTSQEGCSEHCKAVCGWNCVDGICTSECGDGQLVGDEECDHWGLDNMGCDLDCKEQPGFNCNNNECLTECGDSIIAGDEECDPNNSAANMSSACLTPSCEVSDNWRCDLS